MHSVERHGVCQIHCRSPAMATLLFVAQLSAILNCTHHPVLHTHDGVVHIHVRHTLGNCHLFCCLRIHLHVCCQLALAIAGSLLQQQQQQSVRQRWRRLVVLHIPLRWPDILCSALVIKRHASKACQHLVLLAKWLRKVDHARCAGMTMHAVLA